MSEEPTGELVLDTGPLSHLAQAGWLGVLRTVAGPRAVVITDAVEDELRQGSHSRPHLHQVLNAAWTRKHTLESGTELASAMVSSLADHLIETKYRLPFRPGEFQVWANENGIVAPTEN